MYLLLSNLFYIMEDLTELTYQLTLIRNDKNCYCCLDLEGMVLLRPELAEGQDLLHAGPLSRRHQLGVPKLSQSLSHGGIKNLADFLRIRFFDNPALSPLYYSKKSCPYILLVTDALMKITRLPRHFSRHLFYENYLKIQVLHYSPFRIRLK